MAHLPGWCQWQAKGRDQDATDGAFEVLEAQDLVLGCHTGCAVVQVTDTQVFAAHGNHRAGAKTEALGTKDGSLDDIKSCLEPTVGLHANLGAQAIGPQYLVRLAHAELPRRACVFDTGQRRCACATVVARDRDQIGVCLGNACSDGTDTGLGNQLDRSIE